ncbi:DUF1499 domain-containing protein [Prochlorococcus marinus]|uniref:DUF1499 domain-containing protein n=1 Tax=Prochlorococcus marinus TaxID=1219 RepID=UPI0022B5A3A7|nr:DUF1499 domain-containing protein [Prochlorococcus marinus]
MALTNLDNLPECQLSSNCVRAEWTFPDNNLAYSKLVSIASSMPRVSILENTENYWHGVIRSLIFRFPDDLEILRISSKDIIQVRSASRIGLGDLGVNRKRLDKLHANLKQAL